VNPKEKRSHEISEPRALVHHAFGLAQRLRISTILVQVEEPGDFQAIENARDSENVLWLERPRAQIRIAPRRCSCRYPDTGLTRFSQLNIAFFRAVVEERIALDESVVCLTGVVGSKRLSLQSDQQRCLPTEPMDRYVRGGEYDAAADRRRLDRSR
jgi:diadenylate cyclase